MFREYDVLYDTLENTGQAPTLNITDNEEYTALARLLQKRRPVVPLAPPHSHRRNKADRDIHTFKNHFVAGLMSVDNNFSIYLGCWMVKQAKITMNLLRISRTNPRLLAYAQIFGNFYFNATPMEPPGTKKCTWKTSTKGNMEQPRSSQMVHRSGIGTI